MIKEDIMVSVILTQHETNIVKEAIQSQLVALEKINKRYSSTRLQCLFAQYENLLYKFQETK